MINGCITTNGRYYFVGDEVIYKHSIPAEDVRTLAALSDEEGSPCIFVAEHTIAIYNPGELVNQIFHEFLYINILPIQTTAEATQTEVFQMIPFITTEDKRNILPLLPHCESGCWFPAFTDVVAKGIRKQKGIDEIIHHFSIRLEETMTFGDGGNDISILHHAVIGVAMGNANDEIKEAADHVTASVDEDGIQKALKHFDII